MKYSISNLFLGLFLIVFPLIGYTQRIGIGNSNPESLLSVGANSEFRVDSLGNIKRIRNIAYSFPNAQGLNGQTLVNDGSGNLTWTSIQSSGWSIIGNAGTHIPDNFLGTTDSSGLLIKINNLSAGFLIPGITNTGFGIHNKSAGSGNTSFGFDALYSNSSGTNNIAIGLSSMYSNAFGQDNVALGNNSLYTNSFGIYNTAIGHSTLQSNTEGIANTAIGYEALNSNTWGEDNTGVGIYSLNHNTNGFSNTGVGSRTLISLTTGYENTAIGYRSLDHCTTGKRNTATGNKSGLWISTGSFNTAIGDSALYLLSTGNNNTAVGFAAGYYIGVNSDNTFMGSFANTNFIGTSNSTAIGSGALVTASNMVRIGNSSVNSIGGQVGWSTISDRRVKENVMEDVPGLKFVMLLRPVTYQYNLQEKARITNDITYTSSSQSSLKDGTRFTGFIAQEVESAAKSLGYAFSGVDSPKNESDLYSLRYAEFTVPLVKSVQELAAENEELKKQLSELKMEIENIKKALAK